MPAFCSDLATQTEKKNKKKTYLVLSVFVYACMYICTYGYLIKVYIYNYMMCMFVYLLPTIWLPAEFESM